MATDPHFLGRLDLTVAIDDLDMAMAMRPRMEALAWERMRPILDRVFDRLAPPGMHLQVDRLDLDLGRIAPDDLEADMLAAFERALTEALAAALHDARRGEGTARLIAEPAALLERFEAYLDSGVSPFAGERGELFVPRTLLGRLIEEQPTALAATLRRIARSRQAIERLVLQAGDEELPRLLALLAPSDSALILMLMEEQRRAHRIEPLRSAVRITEEALERLLWMATIEFLLRDAGSQFNRQRYLSFLLQREADRAGIAYADLLQLIGQALRKARLRAGSGSSLQAILTGLLAEEASDPPPPEALSAEEAALAAARDGAFEALLDIVRRRLADRPALDRLVRKLTPPLFGGLIRRIEPANAEGILDLLDDLQTSRQREAEQGFSRDDFGWRMKALTLRYLLHDAGSQFNRRRFLAALLEGEALHLGIDYAVLLRRLSETVERERARSGFRSSLPSVLSDLLLELGPLVAPEPQANAMVDEEAILAAQAGDIEPLLRLLHARLADGEMIERIAAALDPAIHARLIHRLWPAATGLIEELDALIALHAGRAVAPLSAAGFTLLSRSIAMRLLLDHGASNFDRGSWLQAVISALAADSHMAESRLRDAISQAMAATALGSTALRALLEKAAGFASVADDPDIPAELPWAVHNDTQFAIGRRWIERAVADPLWLFRQTAGLSDQDCAQAIGWLAPPGAAAAVLDDLKALADMHAASALAAMDRVSFGHLVRAIAIGYLAALDGGHFDRRALNRALLKALSRRGGIPLGELARRLQRGLGNMQADKGPARAMVDAFAREHLPVKTARGKWASLEDYLANGVPASAGRTLPMLAAETPGELAMRIRQRARAAPGRVPELIARLLEWLLPEELVECLAPGLAAKVLRWADRGGGASPDAWHVLFVALLRGETPSFVPSSGATSGRLDRLAVLAHWLDHGSIPGWADTSIPLAELVAGIETLNLADLGWLFVTGDRERTAQRIARVLDLLDDSARVRLIARLAPWAAREDGVLTAALAGLDPAARAAVLGRAAAASIEGDSFDLRALLEKLPPQPVVATPAPSVEAASGPTDHARLFAWLDGGHLPPAEAAAMVRYLNRLADEGDVALAAYFGKHRSSRTARARWAQRLPGAAVARVVRLIGPPGAGAYVEGAMLLHTAWRRIAGFGARRIDQAELWTMLLDLAAEPIDLPELLERLSRRMSGDDPGQATRLRDEARRIARDGGRLPVAAALRREKAPPPASRPPAAPADRAPDAVDSEPDMEPAHALHVANAGLVLLSPYLPALFERLGLLGRDDKGKPAIVTLDARSRAVHLLQYMVDERLDRPEPALPLNKLLCGLSPSVPVEESIAPVPADLDICESLLKAVIGNWPIIKNSSLAGLRETFLQREALLLRQDDRWELRVERKGVDVLVDRIPWTFATICHGWMAEPIHVTW